MWSCLGRRWLRLAGRLAALGHYSKNSRLVAIFLDFSQILASICNNMSIY